MKSFLTLLFTILSFSAFSQEGEQLIAPKFQKLDLRDGLTNLNVSSIVQDDLGYIWIATARGLNRYDGISFKHYLYSEDENSLYNDMLAKVYKNHEGILFCSTFNGVNLFDTQLEKMYRIPNDHGGVYDFIDFDRKTYGITPISGLCVFDPLTKEFEKLPHIDNEWVLRQLITDKSTGIWGSSADQVVSFVPFSSSSDQDASASVIINYNPKNDIFRTFPIPDQNGLFSDGPMVKLDSLIILSGKHFRTFNVNSLEFIPFPARWSELTKLKEYEIWFIKQMDEHTLWIGTRTHGLFTFKMNTNTLVNHNRENSEINSNWPTCILKDRDNNIWLGTFDHGVNIAFNNRGIVNTDNTLNNLTRDRFINSIIADEQDNYYLGTRYDGIYVYNSSSKISRQLTRENSYLSSNHIISTFIDSQQKLWVSDENALHITNKETGHSIEFVIQGDNEGMGALCEQDGRVFASSDRQGFFIFDLNGSLLKQEKAVGLNISKIIPLNPEELLVASYEKGIFRYNINSGAYENIYLSDSPNKDKLPQSITIHLDADSVLWIGNYVGGLHKLDLNDGSIKVYTMEDGLPNNDIVGIVEDQSGALWLSTSYGISRFDKKQEFINFFYNEGLENLQFHAKSALLDKNGIVYFGGSNGLNYFDPLVLSQSINKIAPNIILEKLTILNEEISPGDDTEILSEILNNTGELNLNHRQNSITIDYHAFDFVAANEIRYAYMLEGLEGLEEEWTNVGNRGIAIFSNLHPGHYTFMVKAQNNWGIWSEVSSIAIHIKPSPFLTVWAFIIYSLLILAASYITFQLVLRAQLYKSRLEVEHNERLRENEISQMKMRFFTNISHEIRTPLTLIKGNVDLLSNELGEKNIKIDSFKGLHYSTNRLLSLVNQLLSFRKLENDALDLKIRKDDLIQITRNLIQPFVYVASSRDIEVKIETELDRLVIPIDPDKYEKVMSNLLSNSLKHVGEQGQISIKIKLPDTSELKGYFKNGDDIGNNSFVEISVIDNGRGIPEEDLAHIFDRFAQSKTDKAKHDYSGTGIGLDFTKRLVELHQGAIIVSSTGGVETIFSFVLPVNDKSYAKDSWVSAKSEGKQEKVRGHDERPTEPDTNKEKPMILLVEDDLELNRFIGSSLKDQFNVVSAYNGKEGINLAQNQLPALIISDIMMPEMDGFELCKQIREDELISHIPVILLTAKPDVESKIAGYKYGADDYILKPFDQQTLVARINNLIESRKKLQDFFKQGILADPRVDISNQVELTFVKRIESILTAEYHSPALNVNLLAEKMNMSRTNFYRKFMSVMDISPKDFLTRYRINKSIEMMREGNDNLGEISVLCGFGSQSNYTAIFKKEKGLTPLQFKMRM